MQRQASKAKKVRKKIRVKGTTGKWRREMVGQGGTRTESKRRSDRQKRNKRDRRYSRK